MSLVALLVVVPIVVELYQRNMFDRCIDVDLNCLLLLTPTWLVGKAVVMVGYGGIHQPMGKFAAHLHGVRPVYDVDCRGTSSQVTSQS